MSIRRVLALALLDTSGLLLAQSFDPSDYSAMPLPRISAGGMVWPEVHLQAVRHDLITGEVEVFDLPSTPPTAPIEGYEPPGSLTGTLDNGVEVQIDDNSARSFNLLTPADQLGWPAYPFSAVTKVYMNYASGGTSFCSGAMICPRCVHTAGHCATTFASGNITSGYAQPGYNMGTAPYGSQAIVAWWSVNAWINGNNWNYDVAVFELDQNVGYSSGWLGFASMQDDNWYLSGVNVLNSIGYPGQDDFGQTVFEGGERMYAMQGTIDMIEPGYPNSVGHYNIGFHGQSGSGLYYRDPVTSNRYVLGALSHGNGQVPPYTTFHARVTGDWFNFVSTVCVAIMERSGNASPRYYPNPAAEKLMVEVQQQDLETNTHLSVSDAMGRTVLDLGLVRSPVVAVDISSLNSGTYLLKLSSAIDRRAYPFVKE